MENEDFDYIVTISTIDGCQSFYVTTSEFNRIVEEFETKTILKINGYIFNVRNIIYLYYTEEKEDLRRELIADY